MKNINKKQLILIACFPIFLILVMFLKTEPVFVEKYYSSSVYPVIASFFRILFGWLPVSVGDIMIIVVVFLVIRGILKLFKTRFIHYKKVLLNFGALLSGLYCCFYLFWGFNYFREPLAEKLDFLNVNSSYTDEDLWNTTKVLTKEINAFHYQITQNDTIRVVTPYSNSEIYQIASESYKNLSAELPEFEYKHSSIKSSIFSTMHSYLGTLGHINPFMAEANINTNTPKTVMPFVVCHEVAHQIGWAPEEEANFIGFLAANSSSDMYFKYSGHYMMLRQLLRELKKRDSEKFDLAMGNLSKGIIKDFKVYREYSENYSNPLRPYITAGYSSYLKANKQDKGIESYSYVVDLLISYYKNKK